MPESTISAPETMPEPLTEAHITQFREEGYTILENVIPEEHLAGLRDECQRFIDLMDAHMDAQGVEAIGIIHKNKRYFLPNTTYRSLPISRFVFSDLMASITRALVGDMVYLFNDQYVVKCAEVGMHFGWHQDSGYIGHDHPPYLSCWCALDDVTEENGTVYILPKSRTPQQGLVAHAQEAGSNDLIGYTGDDPGIPVIVPAGSIALFSSLTFHRSGANTTDQMRRIFLAQYSPQPVLRADGIHLWNEAQPFLRDGVAGAQLLNPARLPLTEDRLPGYVTGRSSEKWIAQSAENAEGRNPKS